MFQCSFFLMYDLAKLGRSLLTQMRSLKKGESNLDQYCRMFCILLEQTQFHQAVCLIMACLVTMDPDGTSQNEESHLNQYCQMFSILLEQTQIQYFNVAF